MIPRTPVFHGDPADDDASHEPAQLAAGERDRAAIAHHAECVRQWLAAPVHERAYYSSRIKAAWINLRDYGLTSQSAAAANAAGVMRANHKLRGRP